MTQQEKNLANGTSLTNAKFEKMLAIPATDVSGQYCTYWLASAWYTYGLRGVGANVYLSYGSNSELGVRPGVSLKSAVRTTGTDIIGAWDIEIEQKYLGRFREQA